MIPSTVITNWTSTIIRSGMLVCAMAVVLSSPRVSFAVDETPSKPVEIDTDQTPADRDEAAPLPVDEEQLASRIVSSLAEASQRLEDGAADTSTIALQQSAADDIASLLKNLRENSQPSSSEQSDSASSQQSGAQSSSRSNGRPNQNRDAAQSNEQAGESAADKPEAEVDRRRNLAQSVWGHLPPKVQEELQRSFSERFAPKYEELIRRYYEALAERPRPMP